MPGQGTIVATGAIGFPPGLGEADPARLKELGVQKVMTMTSTYDHRVIQGAESGSFLRRIDQLLQGEDGFYEEVFAALGLEGRLEAPGGGGRGDRRRARARRGQAGRGGDRGRGAAPGRAGGHLRGQGASHARPPGRPARPARLGAGRRPGARPRHREPHAGADGAHPGERAAGGLPGRDVRRRPAQAARDLLRHDRLRDRAHLGPRDARLAAPGDRVGALPRRAVGRGAAQAARAALAGRGARGLPAQGVPGQEAVLDRGARRAGADARRGDRAVRRGAARARWCSAWRTAAA